MNNSYIEQITLDCLLNKEIMSKLILTEKEKEINKDEFKFYKKRILNLFKEIVSCNSPPYLSPDVKCGYNTFIKSSINYFKGIDNNDLLQEEYKDINNLSDNNFNNDLSCNLLNVENNADFLLMRSIKMNTDTLDKYVKRISTKKKENIILPKQREVNLSSPELKNKGIKKNITNNYENNNTKKESK
jgi:hypothetical protein